MRSPPDLMAGRGRFYRAVRACGVAEDNAPALLRTAIGGRLSWRPLGRDHCEAHQRELV